MLIQILIIVGGVLVAIIVGIIVLIARTHKKVPQGRAIVRIGFGGTKVAYDSGIFVVPVLHRMEEMDITIKQFELVHKSSNSLRFKNGKTVELRAVFYIRANKNEADIAHIAQVIGTERASNYNSLKEIFIPKFSISLKNLALQYDSEELYQNPDKFRDKLLVYIGQDLNGFVLEDLCIEILSYK